MRCRGRPVTALGRRGRGAPGGTASGRPGTGSAMGVPGLERSGTQVGPVQSIRLGFEPSLRRDQLPRTPRVSTPPLLLEGAYPWRPTRAVLRAVRQYTPPARQPLRALAWSTSGRPEGSPVPQSTELHQLASTGQRRDREAVARYPPLATWDRLGARRLRRGGCLRRWRSDQRTAPAIISSKMSTAPCWVW